MRVSLEMSSAPPRQYQGASRLDADHYGRSRATKPSATLPHRHRSCPARHSSSVIRVRQRPQRPRQGSEALRVPSAWPVTMARH